MRKTCQTSFLVTPLSSSFSPPLPPALPSPQRQWIQAATHLKSSDEIPRPLSRLPLLLYRLVRHFLFEWTLFGVILVNGVCTTTALIIKDRTGLQVLESINYIFVAIYIVEAILKASCL